VLWIFLLAAPAAETPWSLRAASYGLIHWGIYDFYYTLDCVYMQSEMVFARCESLGTFELRRCQVGYPVGDLRPRGRSLPTKDTVLPLTLLKDRGPAGR